MKNLNPKTVQECIDAIEEDMQLEKEFASKQYNLYLNNKEVFHLYFSLIEKRNVCAQNIKYLREKIEKIKQDEKDLQEIFEYHGV